MNVNEKEAIKTDSKISAMRIAFFWTIKFVLVLSAVVVVAGLVFTWFQKPNYPWVPLVSLIGVLGGIAYGGKAAQSFGENSFIPPSYPIAYPQPSVTYPTATTMPAVSQIHPKVSGFAEEPPSQ
jgi:hypothetical protein